MYEVNPCYAVDGVDDGEAAAAAAAAAGAAKPALVAALAEHAHSLYDCNEVEGRKCAGKQEAMWC